MPAGAVTEEIEKRKYSAKIEMLKTHFVRCDEVNDPIMVFNPEFSPLPPRNLFSSYVIEGGIKLKVH